MATVITNLLSAIPVFGQDIVELIWGGLNTEEPQYGDVLLKILLNAGTSPIFGIIYGLFLILLTISVKTIITWGQSAGVRSISTSEASQRLHAEDLVKDSYYITGFSDGEACFHISVLKNKNYKTGYVVLPIFSIQLHIKDHPLLEQIKNYFQVGTLLVKSNKTGNATVIYSVQSIKDINNYIIPHFDKYPLLTKKRADYLLFKEIVNLMNNSKHLNLEGLREIIALKASMNKGLSDTLKKEFQIIPVLRPTISNSSININWLIGFIEAEGCFICLIRKNITHLIGFQVTLSFNLSQHSRDLNLMIKIKEFLGLGKIYKNNSIVNLTITKKSEIDILISTIRGELRGAKNLEFEDLVKIQEIINNDLHKTQKGLNKIIEIKKNMNYGRNGEN